MVRVGLRDHRKRTTSHGPNGGLLLARYLSEGLDKQAWRQIEIPLSDFPTDDQEPADGVTGPVDFSRISGIAILVVAPEHGGPWDLWLALDDFRFEGARGFDW
jgi:hypothetical protein